MFLELGGKVLRRGELRFFDSYVNDGRNYHHIGIGFDSVFHYFQGRGPRISRAGGQVFFRTCRKRRMGYVSCRSCLPGYGVSVPVSGSIAKYRIEARFFPHERPVRLRVHDIEGMKHLS